MALTKIKTGSVSDSITLTSPDINTPDIDGGTINGTLIGAATPAAISGTTGQFGTSLNVDGTATMDNAHVPSSGSYEVGGSASGSTAIGSLSNSAGKLTLDTDSTRSIHFKTGGTLRQTIDGATGNVGIGMTPAKLLDLQATDNLAMRFYNSTSFKAGIEVPTSPGDMITGSAVNDLAIRSQGNMLFAAGGATERLRISSAGQITATSSVNGDYGLEIKNTSSTNPYGLQVELANGTSNTVQAIIVARSAGQNKFIVFTNGNAQNINNSYTGISDLKLKENIIDASSQWDDIKALKIRKYSLKADNLDAPNMLGVIAQELEEAGMGGLVDEHPDKDSENNDIGTVTKSVSYSILYMKAVKALQEAMTRIETLEARITALEGE